MIKIKHQFILGISVLLLNGIGFTNSYADTVVENSNDVPSELQPAFDDFDLDTSISDLDNQTNTNTLDEPGDAGNEEPSNDSESNASQDSNNQENSTSLDNTLSASGTGHSVVFKRGGSLAWSKDIFRWTTSSGKVRSSSGYQTKGFIVPNKVSLNGVTRYSKSSSLHKWRGSKTISGHVPTPWGGINVYSKDNTDYYGLSGAGNSSWYNK